jgi:hypothetical protein
MPAQTPNWSRYGVESTLQRDQFEEEVVLKER